MALRSRRAGSVVIDAGRITLAEAPELLLTNTSEDFLRASPSLWAGTGGCVERDACDHWRRLRNRVAGFRLPIRLQSRVHGRDTGESISRFRLGTHAQSPSCLYVICAELIAVAILTAHIRIQQRRHGPPVFGGSGR